MNTFRKAIVGTAVGIAVFVGLPLLAWGPVGARSFFEDPARVAYLVVASALTLVIAACVPAPARTPGDEEKLVRRQRTAVVLLQVLGLCIVVVAPWADRRDVFVMAGSPRALGVVLYAVGHVVTAWSQVTLGKQFSLDVTIQRNHRLITKGPYRLVRHPRYLGILLFTLGFALVFRSGLGVVLVTVEAIVLLWRIRDEEQLLRDEFGAEWNSYAKATWRLIPPLY
jgi:protein-S-isoprenylcysteine O-methyltransferase Ste14